MAQEGLTLLVASLTAVDTNLNAGPSASSGSCLNEVLSSSQPPVIWTCSSGQVSRLNYGSSESMSGIISASAPVTLSFTAFETESGYDKVTLSSCPSTSCSSTLVLLDHYSGSTIPSPVTSSTGIMLIQWQSDGSGTRSGWSAVWSSGESSDPGSLEIIVPAMDGGTRRPNPARRQSHCC